MIKTSAAMALLLLSVLSINAEDKPEKKILCDTTVNSEITRLEIKQNGLLSEVNGYEIRSRQEFETTITSQNFREMKLTPVLHKFSTQLIDISSDKSAD